VLFTEPRGELCFIVISYCLLFKDFFDQIAFHFFCHFNYLHLSILNSRFQDALSSLPFSLSVSLSLPLSISLSLSLSNTHTLTPYFPLVRVLVYEPTIGVAKMLPNPNLNPNPLVHALVYEPTTGEAKMLPVDFGSYLRELRSVYDLYRVEDNPIS
jgi:hypothetical protein